MYTTETGGEWWQDSSWQDSDDDVFTSCRKRAGLLAAGKGIQGHPTATTTKYKKTFALRK